MRHSIVVRFLHRVADEACRDAAPVVASNKKKTAASEFAAVRPIALKQVMECRRVRRLLKLVASSRPS